MYKFLKITLLLVGMALVNVPISYAQEKQKITNTDYANNEVPMADVMRSNGKIYIVVATVVALFAGIVIYLVLLDKKIGKLEEKFEEEQASISS